MDVAKLKLGKSPRKDNRRIPMLSKYQISSFTPPPAVDNYSILNKFRPLPVFANDQLSDCTCVTPAHAMFQWTALKGETPPLTVPTSKVIELYSATCGYNPSDPQNTDNGGYITDVLMYLARSGYDIGNGFPEIFYSGVINHRNLTEIRQVIATSGNVYLGVELPLAAQDLNAVWDVPPSGISSPRGVPGGWGGHACLTGETLIPLLDGTEVPIKDLPTDKDFWVYSCSPEGRVVPGRGRSLGRTRINSQIYKVTLDNGEVVRCTEDHPFMLRDGSYVNADKLVEGTSLMPLYKSISTSKSHPGYEKCYNPQTNSWIFTHRLIASETTPEFKGKVVHHADFNKRNNNPENLILMSWKDHTDLHSLYARPENLLKYARSEKGRQKSSLLMKALWNNPEWATKALSRVSENGKKSDKQPLRVGFQDWLNNGGREIISERAINTFTGLAREPEITEKIIATKAAKKASDPNYCDRLNTAALNNISIANKINKERGPTETQRHARSMNARKLNYNKYHKDKFETFEEYNSVRNHKVISVEKDGFEDVYDLNVDKWHNFAVSSGVFVHNCLIVGYDQNLFYILTWGTIVRATISFMLSYASETYWIENKTSMLDTVGKTYNNLDWDALGAALANISR